MNKILKQYIQPAFLICTATLAISAIAMPKFLRKLDVTLQKDPIYLIKPFNELNKDALAPYRFVRESRIPAEIEDELGTKEYIQWLIEDTSVPQNSPVRYCSLFLTYYTGINDRIPHVPDECYQVSGATTEAKDDITIKINYADSRESKDGKLTIPVRHLQFSRRADDIWEPDQKMSVMYFLSVSNKYAGNRTSARIALGTGLSEYSYFSKVEWRFLGQTGNATAEQAAEASVKLLETLVPILEEEHWPDIEKADRETEEN